MKYFQLAAIIFLLFCSSGFPRETHSNVKEQLITGIDPQCEVAEYLFKDLNNDNYDEFSVVGRQGQIKTWSYTSQQASFEAVGNSWSLPFPTQTLLSLSSFSTSDKTLYLMSLTPEGLTAYPINQNGSIEPEGILINSRMKFLFRMDQPGFANFLQDINQDGLTDVILPVMNYCEIWINTDLADKQSLKDKNDTPTFSKIGKFPIEMSHSRQTDLQNTEARLSENFSIPNLTLKDINGDKHPDLVVSHKPVYDFYILGKDGTIPEKPAVYLDLNLFQDTTPKAEGIQFGETLSINRDPQLIESDLNNDKIPDYIIFHGRKLWIFHGTNQGPQFTDPSSIIKMAEDITLLLPLPLDEDDYPDLLMLKVQIPTLANLLRAIFTDWEIKMESIGYKSIQGESFELSSTWTGEVFLQLPSFLSIIANPDFFEEYRIEQKYGPAIHGDFNGDGFVDVAMSNKKNGNFEIWFGGEQDSNAVATEQDEQKELASKIRKVLFTKTDNVWDLDRIIRSLNSLINDHIVAITGGADPDFHMAQFKDNKNYKVMPVDFNHDKINELLFIYSDPKAENLKKFDVYTIKGK
jgi:hypothetical protein